MSNLYKLCFQTDTTIFVSSNKTNKNAFTLANMLNMKTQIYDENNIDNVKSEYKIRFPNIRLWIFDLDIDIESSRDIENIICIVVFVNEVYGLHYICNTNTILDKKTHILNNIKKKIGNNIENNIEKNIDMYSAYTLRFNSSGKINTSTTIYEKCSIWL